MIPYTITIKSTTLLVFILALLCLNIDCEHLATDDSTCPKNEGGVCKFPIHSLTNRDQFGYMCAERGFEAAAELGMMFVDLCLCYTFMLV